MFNPFATIFSVFFSTMILLTEDESIAPVTPEPADQPVTPAADANVSEDTEDVEDSDDYEDDEDLDDDFDDDDDFYSEEDDDDDAQPNFTSLFTAPSANDMTAQFYVTIYSGPGSKTVALEVENAEQTVPLGTILAAQNVNTAKGEAVLLNGQPVQTNEIPTKVVRHGDSIIVQANMKAGSR